jgi:hypothetical protein
MTGTGRGTCLWTPRPMGVCFCAGGLLRVHASAPTVPIGEWFRLESRQRCARDDSGEVALYQD